MNKSRTIALSSFCLLFSVLAVTGSLAHKGLGDDILATNSSYGFVLDKDNRLGDEGTGNIVVRSESEASVLFSYSGLSNTLPTDGFQILPSGSYFYNLDPIHGLSSLSIGSSGPLSLYWSIDPIDASSLGGLSTVSLEADGTSDFNLGYPHYMLIKNAGDSDVSITSLSIEYDCYNRHAYELGSYPQTKVTDTTLLSRLDAMTSSVGDYLTLDGNRYLKGDGGYYKSEAILWDSYGDGTLISQRILDAMPYYASATDTRDSGGTTVYPNNYRYSSIRAFLNSLDGRGYGVADYSSGSGFLDRAFTTDDLSKIEVTTVDNSGESTSAYEYYKQDNPYACEDTSDRVFLLSWTEAIASQYGFSTLYGADEARVKTYSDYAGTKEMYNMDASSKVSAWWLRSPGLASGSVDYGVSAISNTGLMATSMSPTTVMGLVPAVRLKA